MSTAQPRPSPPPLSARKQAAFTLVLLLVVLLLIEAAVRIYHFVGTIGKTEIEPRGYVVDDPDMGYTLKRGFNEGGIRVNSLGFRGPEITQDKPPGTYRIVSLGDSATFGPQQSECAYPFLMADRLPGVEDINAAVEGYRSDRALARLRKDVLPLKPDLVTVFIGWNDLYQTDPRQETEQLKIEEDPLQRILNLSDAAQTFRRWYYLRFAASRPNNEAIDDPALLASYEPRGYEERLREILRTAKAGGADTVVFTWPTILSEDMSPAATAKAHFPWYTVQIPELRSLYNTYQQSIRTVAQQEGVPVLDAAALFDHVDRAEYFNDSAHFTCEGQAMIADELARFVRASGRLPG